jgi:hypothetical protein
MEQSTISISLMLVGNIFDTDFVTEVIGRNPDWVRRKGDPIIGGLNEAKCTRWVIEIGERETIDFISVFSELFPFIRNKREQLLYVAKKCDSDWRVGVCVNIRNCQVPALWLSNEAIQMLHQINATIDFDVYILD